MSKFKDLIESILRESESQSVVIDEVTAYAGSKQDYDQPSLEFIGTGEGHQAHGWGLYYALNQDIADKYRKNSLSQEKNEYDNFDTYIGDRTFENIGPARDATDLIFEKMLDGLNLEEAFDAVFEERYDYGEKFINFMENAYYEDWNITNEDLKKFNGDFDGGQVHEVELPEMDFLLDEQKLLEEHPQEIQNAIVKFFNERYSDYEGEFIKSNIESLYDINWNDLTGGELYHKIANDYYQQGYEDAAKEASQVLDEYGIKGITYDGRQDGRCFVIFNPANVKVVKKLIQAQI